MSEEKKLSRIRAYNESVESADVKCNIVIVRRGDNNKGYHCDPLMTISTV